MFYLRAHKYSNMAVKMTPAMRRAMPRAMLRPITAERRLVTT